MPVRRICENDGWVFQSTQVQYVGRRVLDVEVGANCSFVSHETQIPITNIMVIQPFDRNAVASMEKAIMGSDLGLTPSNDGNVIRLAFPTLTEERRKDLIKLARDRAEEGRVSVRNVRRHAKEHLEREERDHTISEDDLRRAEKELQRLTDHYVTEIDHVLEQKEKELGEV